MIRSTQKFIAGALVFMLLFVISDVADAYETDTVQFNATLGFGEYGFDSGYIGLDDPLARMLVHAYGTLGLNLADITMNGSVWTDNGLIGVNGTSNGGNFSFSLGLEYGAYAYYGIPVLGLDYEIDLLALLGVPSMDLLLEDSQTFTPFLLDSSIQISDSLPPQKFGDFDVTNILFPGVPFVGAGVTLDADMELQENLSGERIYFSNPGSSIYSESSTLSFSGSSTILNYYEDANAEVIVGLWPGFYVDAFGWRFDFPVARIPVTVYSSDLPLPFNNSAANFSSTTTSLNVSATVTPNSNVPPYSTVNVNGTVTYNTGGNVRVGIVTINTGYDVYTAAIDNGSFNRNVHVSTSSGNISITAEDFDYGLSQTIYKYVSIQGDQGGDGYTLYRTTTCHDVEGSNPYDPIYETEWFRRSENQAVVWLHFTELYESIRAKWEFYEPDGTLHITTTSNWTDDPGSGTYYDWWKLWASVYVDGYLASYRPGLWSCKVYIDDGGGWDYRKTEYFTIGFDFTEHRMAKDVQSSYPYMPINETTVFYQTDTKALTWANCDNVSESFDVKWEYYEPDGSLYSSFPYTTDDPGANSYFEWSRFWGWTMINGYSAANKCGDWHVDVFIRDAGSNYQKTYTDYFQILENPSVNPNVSVSANPSVPIETQSVTLNLTATDNTYLDTVELYWKVNGLEQTPEISSNINTGQKNISHNIGTVSSGQQIEYWGVAIDTSGNRAEGQHTTITVLSEVVTTPDRPSGEVYLKAGQSGTYTTGGSSTTLGHSVQYEFDWGDSTLSGFGLATQVKSWPSDGHYFIKAHARCQIHTNRESGWSTPIIVNVDSISPVVDINTNGGVDFGTSLPQVVITGTVDDVEPTSGLAAVSINTGATNDGTLFDWQFTINLSEGPNPLTITATDNAGNTGFDTIIVTYMSSVPEINIKHDFTDILNDTGSHDFGAVLVGGSSSVMFTIENLGSDNLELIGSPIVDITGTHASDFVVTQEPATPVSPADFATFDITFSPSGLGIRNATISILNNDSDENPYNISISGTGVEDFYEDFEAGDFSNNPWLWGGDTSWFITSSDVYDGNYAAQSGTISDDQSSIIEVTKSLPSGNIIFGRKVSSQEGSDWLMFYIDGSPVGIWSGEKDWAEKSYFIKGGTHTFDWVYQKDSTISEGNDCGWIDGIIFEPEPVDPALYYWADFHSYSISVSDMVVTPNSFFAYNWYYEDTWYIYGAGGGFIATFESSSAGQFELVVRHLSAASSGCPGGGYSPVTINLNGIPIVSNYDPAENHGGSHGLVTDTWVIDVNVGTNTLEWVANDLCTNYWIQGMEIRHPIGLEGDLDYDSDVDFNDIGMLVFYWLEGCSTPNWCGGRDIDKSGSIDLVDFSKLAQNWFEGVQ